MYDFRLFLPALIIWGSGFFPFSRQTLPAYCVFSGLLLCALFLFPGIRFTAAALLAAVCFAAAIQAVHAREQYYSPAEKYAGSAHGIILEGSFIREKRSFSGGQTIQIWQAEKISDTFRTRRARQVICSAGNTAQKSPADFPADVRIGQRYRLWGTLKKKHSAFCDFWMDVSRMRKIESAPPRFRAAHSIRSGFAAVLSHIPGEQRNIFRGVVLGDDDGFSPNLKRAFRISGLTHLTAVSGAHISLILSLVIGICGMRHRFLTAGIAFACLLQLLALVGLSASVLRAGLMAAFLLCGIMLRRRLMPIPLLGAALITGRTVFAPIAAGVGFVMSAAATLAIVLVTPWLKHCRFPPLRENILTAAVISFAAGTVTLPLSASFQPQISLFSVPANIAVAPVIPFLTLLGLLGALISPFSITAASWAVALCRPCAWWVLAVAEKTASLTSAVVCVPRALMFQLAVCVLFYLCIRAYRNWPLPLNILLFLTVGVTSVLGICAAAGPG